MSKSGQPKFVVIGDVMIDKLTMVDVVGLDPETNGTLKTKAVKRSEFFLGGAANVAVNLNSLSERNDAMLFCRIGRDDTSATFLDMCRARNINVVFDEGTGDTPLKHRYRSPYGQLFRVDRESPSTPYPMNAWRNGGSSTASRKLHEVVNREKIAAVCLVNYDKGFFNPLSVIEIMQLIEKSEAPIIVDPGKNLNWDNFRSPMTVFKVNLDQCAAFLKQHTQVLPDSPVNDSKRTYSETEYRSVFYEVRRIMSFFNFHSLVITLGPGGIIAGYRDTSHEVKFKRPASNFAADPCGAGDTVMAAIALVVNKFGLTASTDFLRTVVRYGNDAAGVAASNVGTYAPKPCDLDFGL